MIAYAAIVIGAQGLKSSHIPVSSQSAHECVKSPFCEIFTKCVIFKRYEAKYHRITTTPVSLCLCSL